MTFFVRGTMIIGDDDDVLRIPMRFDMRSGRFEYVRNPRYMYYNYVNQGSFEYEYEDGTLTLSWDVWPQEIYDRSSDDRCRYELRRRGDLVGASSSCVKHVEVDLRDSLVRVSR